MKYRIISNLKNLYAFNKELFNREDTVVDLSQFDNNLLPDEVFSYNNVIVGIIASSRLKIVGKNAFSYCKKLKFFDSDVVTIGDSAFKSTAIEKFNFEDVLYMEDNAFANSNLKIANLKVLKTIPKKAFSNCFYLRECHFNNVETIEQNAFYATNLSRVVFPESLKHIKEEAFKYNPMLSDIIFLGSNAPKVYKSSFENCGIQNIWIFDNIEDYKKKLPKDLHEKIKLIKTPNDIKNLLI